MLNLISTLKKLINPATPDPYPDFDDYHWDIINHVQEYTMTSPERLFSLIEAVKYIIKKDVKGAIVECGVWRGGSIMAAIKTLQSLNIASKQIILYDTFDGMSEPTELDKSQDGKSAAKLLQKHKKTEADKIWAYATLEDVQKNVCSLKYPEENISFHKGKVEETIPNYIHGPISLLRLDTDWYESTKHELTHLFPLLSPGGVLIIDDYGHWQGARRAVDEYLEQNGIKMLLNRVDYTGRVGIKL